MEKSGELHLILGPMHSSKTNHLINELSKYQAIGKKTFCISSTKDNRSPPNTVQTHDGIVIPAQKAYHLTKTYEGSTPYHNISPPHVPYNTHVIGIDEAQFFEDLEQFIQKKLEENYILIVAGLDGDYKQKPFGSILNFIPIADTYTKLYAMCAVCRDGTRAPFTKRVADNEQQELIGSYRDGTYISVCRRHL